MLGGAWLRSAWRCPAAGCALLVALTTAASVAQEPGSWPHPLPLAKPQAQDPVRIGASLTPSLSLPVAPLGFAMPGEYYLGHNESLLSIDFLDEQHLLFTFRVPGLLHRETPANEEEAEREIRALVLHLPSGAITAESQWKLHGYSRYLWLLPGGHFLLRDRNTLMEGDAGLHLHPGLTFSGELRWIEPDQEGKWIVAGLREEPTESSSETPLLPTKIEIIRRQDAQVLAESYAARRPVPGAESYLTTRYREGLDWDILRHLSSGTTVLSGAVRSGCNPLLSFVGHAEILATECDTLGGWKLAALSLHGEPLWEVVGQENASHPLLLSSASGARLMRESMMMSHALLGHTSVTPSDVRSQQLDVMDAASGKTVFTAQAWPVLDAGGNAAISPSGNRVAVFMGDAIRIFDLSPAPPLLLP